MPMPTNKEMLRKILKAEYILYRHEKQRVRKALKEDNHPEWNYAITQLNYHGARIGLLNKILGESEVSKWNKEWENERRNNNRKNAQEAKSRR